MAFATLFATRRASWTALIVVGSLTLACNSVDSDWAKAQRDDTKASYETFIAKHSGEIPFVEKANAAIEELAWREAAATNTRDAYRSYTETYPNGAHVAEALDGIALVAWDEARKAESIPALQEFRVRYGGTRYEHDATAAIEQMVFAKSPGKKGVVELEDLAIQEIRHAQERGVPVTRLKLDAFEVDLGAPGPARFTIQIKNGVQVLSMNFPKDGILMGFGGPGVDPPMFGDGSVHRFNGTIDAGRGDVSQVIGDVDPLHHLTFAALKDVGYVYLRGRGQVKFKNGTSVRLGY